MSPAYAPFEPSHELTEILGEALDLGASDVHFYPADDRAEVRLRVHGSLVKARIRPTLPVTVVDELSAVAGLAADRDATPAEASIQIQLRGAARTFRLSRMPGIDGNRVCLHRVMGEPAALDKLGMDEQALRLVTAILKDPWGIVLFGGPAGCGKTTTFYAALGALDPDNRCVVTVEDVVEARVPGVHQMQSAGRAFQGDAWLRAMMHQDPDAMGLGEIHDLPTAMFAMRAALSGSRVLSTAAFNSAPSCVSRLLNWGVEPFLLTSALRLIVCQRLVQVSCEYCMGKDDLSPELLHALGLAPQSLQGVEPRKGFGCEKCRGTGVAGRSAIFEVLELTPALREFVLMGASTDELKSAAMRDGFKTLRQHALDLFVQGRIPASEVLGSTPSDAGLPEPPSLPAKP